MIEEQSENENLSFSEKLLGLQGFNAARAQRYRAELEKLLVHRIKSKERWAVGFTGVVMLLAFGLVALTCAMSWEQPNLPISSATRWTFTVACTLFALLFGGWLLRIALRGGYSRYMGEIIGVGCVLVLCGSFAFLFFSSASNAENDSSRILLSLGGGVIVACMLGCVVLTVVERMHRQTQEKLLRIEYHVAELLERRSAS
jgi:hypothetical protein